MGYDRAVSSSEKRGKTLRVAISVGLAAVLLVLFLRTLDFAAVGKAIRGAHVGWLVAARRREPARDAALPLLALGPAPQAGREPSAFDLNSATSIGFAASTLLPARAGEIVRPVALARRAGLPVAPCLASVALERLIDLVVCVLLFVVYAIGWAPQNMAGEAAGRFALLRQLALVFGAGTFAGLVVLGFLAAKPERTDRFVKPLLKPLPVKIGARIEAILLSFLDGLGALGTAKDVAIVAASSLALWALIASQVWMTLLAFDVNVPYPVSFFVLAWAILGLAIPTPGGVGGYHTAVAYSLTAFYGVGKDTAGAFALVSHALSFVPITLLGLVFLLAGGLSLKSLREEGKKEEDAETRAAAEKLAGQGTASE